MDKDLASNFISTSWLWIDFCHFEIWACNRGHKIVGWSEEAANTTAAKYHPFVDTPSFSTLYWWFNFTRGLKITITFTYGRIMNTTYPGIKIIISSNSFWPEARIRRQQILKERGWTWIRTWPQTLFHSADFELTFVILKYELATVGIKSWTVWGSY